MMSRCEPSLAEAEKMISQSEPLLEEGESDGDAEINLNLLWAASDQLLSFSIRIQLK